MIVHQDIKPEKNVYYLGAILLNAINTDTKGLFDPTSLYYKFTNSLSEKVSYNQFLYTLDWLFICGKIELTQDFKIKRCI